MGDLLVCSHRGPVALRRARDGLESAGAGPGGLVAVVSPAIERLGGTWLFAPGSPEEREIAASGMALEQGGVSYVVLDIPAPAHEAAYRTIYTELLVPLFHYLLSLPHEPTFERRMHSAWEGYRQLNGVYGAAIRRHARGEGVLVEDAHLMLAAAAARRAPGGPDGPFVYFHHMPWCEPEYFGVLPDAMRAEILAGLLAFDSVGFHCARWADAFASCCERFLGAARESPSRLRWQGRSVGLVVAPAAPDAERLRARCAAPPSAAWRERLRAACGERRAIIRVERLDPAKNLIRGLRAYELLLDRRPDLLESTCLLGVLTPVREWAPAYRRYRELAEAEGARINARFAHLGPDRAPVLLHLSPDPHAFDHHRALAGLSLAEVVLATPLYDGLNIVPLEAAVVGEPSIVLSANAGAHAHIADHVRSVNPFDTLATADAIERALDEPAGERRRRARALRSAVSARTPEDWVRERLAGAG
jgi:trehalose 6-phosphate synthase